MGDARFEDGADRPLALKVEAAEDVPVLSALLQDAVLPVTEIRFDRRRRRLALLLNRFRWEDRATAEARRRPYERVQSLLIIDDVQHVASQGVDRAETDTVLSILSLNWSADADGSGRVELVLAGDGAIAATVECLNLTLKDVTRPYAAPSRRAPSHPD